VIRALVIGGAGFIGTAACKELMRRGVETVAAGRTPRPYGVFTSFRAFDRREPEQLSAALQGVGPDVVLDLAASRRADVLDVLARFEGGRYVLVSADSDVYETALERGSGVGAGMEVAVVRPAPVFGPDDPSLRIAAYLQRIDDGGPLLVPEESFERPTGLAWVRDAGYACALACDLRHHRVGRFDVTFDGVSLKDLLEAVAGALNRRLQLVPVPFASLPDGASPYGPDPRQPPVYDLGLSRRVLGFQPSSLEEALVETLAWYLVRRPSHPGYASRQAELELAVAPR
jgi:nucleoside-diphosphate-sugar epimerase